MLVQHISSSGDGWSRCQTRAKHAFENANIRCIGELVLLSERDLLKIPRTGKRTLAAIIAALRTLAEERDVPLALGMDVQGWKSRRDV
ncbi:MAG: DNA-directed RNA polymerase subunit alpha C-terminal domain-containing protein [Candidatus Magasanikbacteria bacterium]|nr:DNA-directed RNA polymerase subunit alpha C-terminal domain-containing protein [Candidatus Magasanikbacteria bacterium]